MSAIAARTGSREPHIVDHPGIALPSTGEVVCRTLELGICGTDREILESARPWLPPRDDHLILGHECLALVEEVGAGVTELRSGDLVVPVVRRPRPGARERVDMLSFGDYTERGIAFEHGFSMPLWLDRPEYLYPVGRSVAPVAVLTEPLAVAEKGVNEALIVQRARLGEGVWREPPPRALVTGLGPIAFAAVLACSARRWPVSVYGRDEPQSFRARLAVAFGASYVEADSFRAPAASDIDAEGFDLVLECTGSDEVMLRSVQALASRGVMVWLGSLRTPTARQHNVAALMRSGLLRNHIHIASINAAPRDFEDALRHLEEMYRSHAAEVEALITARVTLADSLPHYRGRQPQGIKTVIEYER